MADFVRAIFISRILLYSIYHVTELCSLAPARLLLIGGTSRLLRKAENLDLAVVNIRKRDDLAADAAAICEAVHVLELNDVDQVTHFVRTLHIKEQFSQVICHSEPLQMLTGHLCTELGIAGTSFATVKAMRDKFALRDLMRECALSNIDSEVATSAEDIIRFTVSHREAIAKPRSGGGSLGVHFVRSADEAVRAWAWADSVGLSELLVEEVLRGPEVSIEFFTHDGKHFPLAATSKTLAPGFVEIGHAVPAMLTEEQFAAACQLVTSVLDLVGYRWGPSHTEVIFTDRGPELVESHTRRAGNHINELVHLACGVDMEALCFWLASGQKISVPALIKSGRPAAIRLLSAAPGRVVAINGLDEVKASVDVAEAEVYSSLGDVLQGLRWSGDYAGHVIARGATTEEAMNAAEREAAQISIKTVPRYEGEEFIPASQASVSDIREALDPFDKSWTS